MSKLAPFEARLFVGHVMHLRLRPRKHQFRYRVFCCWLDIDRLEETASSRRLFALDRFGLFGFNRRDHGPRDGEPLRPWVEALLAETGLEPPARIMLLSFPRVLGYVFNPLSVYYCYDAEDRLTALVYEVKNTFGDQHAYALPAGPAEGGAHRQQQGKELFVSPFIDMAQRYHFVAAPPGDRLALRIKENDAEGELLIATWNGAAEPLTDTRLARRFVTHPLMTLGVIAAIHWQALRLFLKGVRFLGHPGDDAVLTRRRGAEAKPLVGEGVVHRG